MLGGRGLKGRRTPPACTCRRTHATATAQGAHAPAGCPSHSWVEADDERERVGEGTHERFVVDMGRFMERIAAKQS
jgi:hypothetical protein